ncbi:MAG: hypothetical protein K1X89_06720 [Myxococcaceae bacterium]|nr:hypothetical protein [Myxococcaceae bacterium]
MPRRPSLIHVLLAAVALVTALSACGQTDAQRPDAPDDRAQTSSSLEYGLTPTEWVPYGGPQVTPWRRYEKVWPNGGVQAACGGGGWGVWYRFWIDGASPDSISVSDVEFQTDSEGQDGSMTLWNVNVYGSNASQGFRGEADGWARSRSDGQSFFVSPNRSFDHADESGLPVMVEFSAVKGVQGADLDFDPLSICASTVSIRLRAYDPFYF